MILIYMLVKTNKIWGDYSGFSGTEDKECCMGILIFIMMNNITLVKNTW